MLSPRSPLTRLCALLLGSSSVAMAASTLYVGTSGQKIFSFQLNGNTLTPVSSTTDSGPQPSWLTITGNTLYAVSETWDNSPGAVTAYSINNGNFQKISSDNTGLSGPVNLAIADQGKLLITAGYGGHGINTYSVNYGIVKKTSTYIYSDKSINPDRQGASFPHQVVVDPTGKFAVVPDLGADFLRVYRIESGNLVFLQNVVAQPGSGPRHGVFWPKKAGSKPTHFYLVSELANTVTAYKLSYGYDGKTLSFSSSAVYSTFGAGIPAGVAPEAGEIDISPDGKFLYVSNRLDFTFKSPSSDSIATFVINSDGTLRFLGLTPSGGLRPRHFSLATLNGKSFITVANSDTGDVAIFTRDPVTGRLGTTPFASTKVPSAAVASWAV